jgi:dihydrofolate reductase
MNISMIAAMDKNRVIGMDNDIPWKLPRDQAYFRKITLDHTIIMGRKNYESMGKPLDRRKNVILSRSVDAIEGCEVFKSIDQVLSIYGEEDELFIIGGEEIYKQFLPYANRLYITLIDHEFEGDTYFPLINKDLWEVASVTNGETDKDNPYNYTFYVYERI